ADLVPIAVLDQQQRRRPQRITTAVDRRHAAAAEDEEPLVGTCVSVLRVAFGLARFQHHLRRLRAPIAEHHVEPFPEPQRFAFHCTLLRSGQFIGPPSRFRGRARWRFVPPRASVLCRKFARWFAAKSAPFISGNYEDRSASSARRRPPAAN